MIALVWVAFIVFIVVMLALDLGVFSRREHVIGFVEALSWTAFWVVLALAFNVVIFFLYDGHWLGIGTAFGHELTGGQAALQFFTGYVIEKSLSMDNIFVIAMIFSYFGVPALYQHRVLFWGVFGALVLRGVMIAAGVALLARFDWIVYVFGALLIITAVKILVVRHDNLEPERNILVRLARRVYPVTDGFVGSKFFVRANGQRAITPLVLVLLMVESTDVLFAVDSIPAIFAVTRDPFIVFTSNVFAILGLRSLYFALAGLMDKFRYVKLSLVFVLAFVGVKMLLTHHYHIPTAVSLAVIGGILSVGVGASILGARQDTAPLISPLADEIENFAKAALYRGRAIVILVVGSTIVIIGIAMLILPGPGIIVIPLGLALLGTEFLWARRLLTRLQDETKRLGGRVRESVKRRA